LTSLAHCEFQLEHADYLSEAVKDYYRAGVTYFKYLMRDDYDRFAHSSIATKIRNTAKKSLFVPCFGRCVSCRGGTKYLGDVYLKENRTWGIDGQEIQAKYWDIRRNHLTEENHRILATNILRGFRSEVDIDMDWDSFVLPKKTDFEKYFIPL
jgi:hypothetical protein